MLTHKRLLPFPYVLARWIALLPAIPMAVTPMVRLLVVFHFLPGAGHADGALEPHALAGDRP